ncbi:MAG TPA: carbon monoxide dehydrogenase subunit G [Chloroflexota bacterium]|nr:carbon monoxide dehydrogenase subunit G [Chloroflexota bacterium]
MRVTGTRTVNAQPEDIWAFLMTPEQLRQCLPGCERFEAPGPDTFEATMRLGVGFLKGTYRGTIRVEEQRPYEYLRLSVRGSGMLGAMEARGSVRLEQPTAGVPITYVHYDGEAEIRGRVAALGQRVIDSTATRLIGLFFSCLASHVQR